MSPDSPSKRRALPPIRTVRAVLVPLLLILVTLAATGCARRPGVSDRGTPRRELVASTASVTEMYNRAGFIAEASPVSFVGTISYLAGPTDTTLLLISLSMPARTLTFTREGDRYRANYTVIADLRQSGATRRHVEAQEVVRVNAFRETTRPDESIIFHQILSVPAGQYVLSLTVRDDGGMKSSLHEEVLNVPALRDGDLSSPITVYAVTPRSTTDSLPAISVSPRATAAFGRDTVVNVYLEGYGGDGDSLPIQATVRTRDAGVAWSAVGRLPRHGDTFSGTLAIPASRIGIGPATLEVMRLDGRDTASTPLLVTFGDDIAVGSFDEMLSYLRYFAPAQRLQTLRDTPLENRATEWAAFLRETDPNPGTLEHEGLREYFERIQIANERFREEGSPGWLSDRGMVFITLGEPDQILEQTTTDFGQRGRLQAWEYRQHNAQLIFVDQTGFGRWRLTTGSEADFTSLVQRLRARGG